MMFGHIFKYRLKCLLRDRILLFWTMLYPMVMATLFTLAFSNISSNEAFTSIPVAIVDNAGYQSDTAFQSALDSVSDANPAAGQKLFHVSVLPQDQAEQALQDNKIKGYILIDNGMHVVVRESGMGQSILKEFMDGYLQMRSAYITILHGNPSAAQNLQAPDTAGYLKEVAIGKAGANSTMTYFYALIAMAALMGGFWGQKQISDIQANLSPQAARFCVAPVHKLKALAYSLCASVLVQFMALLVLVGYMGLALGVDFGGQLPFVLAACLAGSFMGVTFGAAVGVLASKNEGLGIAVLITSSILLSFLSGMMVSTVKYAVTHAVPILAYINPANLIADAFYSLYYYSTYARFFTNVALMLAFSAVFCLLVYFATRRQKYASL
jgi:ABC-2 type transport system permease protein